MARIRNVKPGLFQHGELFDLEKSSGLPLRVAWVAIWCQCDVAGRFRWKPRELKLQCLPFDDVDFDDVLRALASGGFIVEYESDGCKFGYVPNFEKHQKFSTGEMKDGPKHPTPRTKKNSGQTKVRPKSDFGQTREPLTPDSGLLTPDNRQQTTDVGHCAPSALVADKPRRSTAKPIDDRPLGLTPKDVLTAWDARWLRIRGGPYVRTSGAKEGALASKLLKASHAAGIDKAGLGEAMDRFFADPYWADKSATFATFTAAAPGMFQRPPPKAPAMSRLHIEFMEAEKQDARDRENQLRLTSGDEDSAGIVDVSAVGFPCS